MEDIYKDFTFVNTDELKQLLFEKNVEIGKLKYEAKCHKKYIKKLEYLVQSINVTDIHNEPADYQTNLEMAIHDKEMYKDEIDKLKNNWYELIDWVGNKIANEEECENGCYKDVLEKANNIMAYDGREDLRAEIKTLKRQLHEQPKKICDEIIDYGILYNYDDTKGIYITLKSLQEIQAKYEKEVKGE